MPDSSIKRAAGVLFVTDNGRILLMRRQKGDHAGQWAFPGGGIEDEETAEQAARREVQEETGVEFTGELGEWTRRIKDGVDFTTFIGHADQEFDPELNAEHDSYLWADRAAALDMPLHPGAQVAVLRFGLDELGIAKAIRSGDLISPQRFGNLLLAAMRITGTGASYRQSLDEYVWRDPSLYLNEEFLERCNGLPVILEHPSNGSPMNSAEFRERIVGTILLPYIQGDEVWGVAKIYDAATQTMLEENKLSTSPCVVFRPAEVGSKYRMPGGSTLLIEGKPSLLDHLAICELGVWDKGGSPSGVANPDLQPTDGETKMADEKTEDKREEAKADAEGTPTASKEGDKLDKILTHLDSLHKRMDSYEARAKSDAEEPDEEQKRSDDDEEDCSMDADEREDAEEGEEALAEEREENGLKKNDRARKDSRRRRADSRRARKDSEDEDEKEESRGDSETSALRQKIAELEARIPTELPESDRARFVDVQSQAERVAQAFGDSAGAPQWLRGETLSQYRVRLLNRFKGHSPAWKDADLATIAKDDSALATVERQVYSDAMGAALHPASVTEGTLRAVTERDATGRNITKFYGDPEACWGPFKQPSRLVASWNTKIDRVR